MQIGAIEPVVPAGVTQDRPILDFIQSMLPTVGAIITQQQMMDLNRKLIEQGKAPLSAEQLQSLAPGFKVGVDADTKTLLIYALGGIGAFFLVMTLMKSR